ncbi:hypothetical protein BD410DRAFT_840155 [Rickenella mellea]|uniref:Uncharacterized protein n=1 Tax=Rickenella mellea TaxID=50990 RepID=A0A4Y7Q307_9AGAM|nr:hypothetical protein BD410DRAFT_840155 [Rickenella mellea]
MDCPRVKTYLVEHEDVLGADPRFSTLYLVGRAVPAPAPEQQQQPPNDQPNEMPQHPQQPPADQPNPDQHGPHPLNENPPVQPHQIPDHIEEDAPLNLQPGAHQPPPDMPLIPSVDNLSQTVATMFPDADAATRRDYLDGLRTINQRFVSAQERDGPFPSLATQPQAADRGVTGGLLRGGAFLDPPAVVAKLRRGWHDHIPLNLLTDSACATAGHSPSLAQDSLRVHDGQLLVSSTALDPSREHLMSAADLLQAYPRLIRMIRSHYSGPNPDRLANSFQAHYSMLLARPEFWQQTSFMIEFDIHIRKCFLQEPFDLAIWQADVWQTMLEANVFSLRAAAQAPRNFYGHNSVPSRDNDSRFSY